MANLGRHWTEEEIEKLKKALLKEEVEGLDFASIISSIFSIAKGTLNLNSDDTSLAPVENMSLALVALLSLVERAEHWIQIPAILIDLATDITDTYDNLMDDKMGDPDDPIYNFDDRIRKNNIFLGDILNYNLPPEKEFVKTNDDGTHDFSKLIAFQTPSGDIEYLSDVMPNVLSQDLWELIRRD